MPKFKLSNQGAELIKQYEIMAREGFGGKGARIRRCCGESESINKGNREKGARKTRIAEAIGGAIKGI